MRGARRLRENGGDTGKMSYVKSARITVCPALPQPPQLQAACRPRFARRSGTGTHAPGILAP
jgi:hypothetical protein